MSRRTNQEWLDDLSGRQGEEAQLQALRDLRRYLMKISYTYLSSRIDDPSLLDVIAEDSVQDTLLRIFRDQYAVLKTYRGDGNFTSWAKTICIRLIIKMVKKPYIPEVKAAQFDPEETLSQLPQTIYPLPEQTAVNQDLFNTLSSCLDKLNRKQRIAMDTILLGLSGAEAAERMGNTKIGTVFAIVNRTKPKLRRCMEAAGVDASVLEQLDLN